MQCMWIDIWNVYLIVMKIEEMMGCAMLLSSQMNNSYFIPLEIKQEHRILSSKNMHCRSNKQHMDPKKEHHLLCLSLSLTIINC